MASASQADENVVPSILETSTEATEGLQLLTKTTGSLQSNDVKAKAPRKRKSSAKGFDVTQEAVQATEAGSRKLPRKTAVAAKSPKIKLPKKVSAGI